MLVDRFPFSFEGMLAWTHITASSSLVAYHLLDPLLSPFSPSSALCYGEVLRPSLPVFGKRELNPLPGLHQRDWQLPLP